MFKLRTTCRDPHPRVRWPSVPARRRDRIDRTARDVLGFEALRPGQREAIESVLAGRETLAVLSTRAGKSAIYQIAGLLTKGATVVVSPLIALQRDQVDALRERALGAAQLNSSVPAGGGGGGGAGAGGGARGVLLFLPPP